MTTTDELKQLRKEFSAKEKKLLNALTYEERVKLDSPLKSILDLDSFMANGVRYVIRPSLSLERYEEFETLQIPLSFGVAFRNLFENIKEAYTSLNSMLVADASVMLYNIMNGIKDKLDMRTNEVLLICTLFICREGEDVRYYDAELGKQKIEDWKIEGIAMKDFFQLAFSSVETFTPVLQEISASTFPKVEKKS